MRFHVHVAVKDLPASLQFYSQLFGMPPTKERPDYAKWILDVPSVNFAISARGHATGVNHVGFQAETPEELRGLKLRADQASQDEVQDQGEAACCYSESEKHWTMDPQGLAWEHFLTMSDALTYGEDVASRNGACCIPLNGDADSNSYAGAACCITNDPVKGGVCCS